MPSKLRTTDLQTLLKAIGQPTTGTKPVLAHRLHAALHTPLLPASPTVRVLSIDMGIRNLALAALDVPLQPLDAPALPTDPVALARTLATADPLTFFQRGITVAAWARLDLTSPISHLASQSSPPSPPASLSPPPAGSSPSSAGSPAPPPQLDAATLAPIANDLLPTLLGLEPGRVLLETQRHRTGGGAAVQEWSVRVGLVEGMLWALLEAERRRRGLGDWVRGVSPARVVSYWPSLRPDSLNREEKGGGTVKGSMGENSAREEATGTGEQGKDSKKERGDKKSSQGKKDKIALVRQLLEQGHVRCVAEAKNAEAFFRRGKGKTDDLADCALQGVTFCVWEGVRRSIVASGMHGLDTM